jgi:Family of unknown function (DUF6312)
MAKKPPQQGDSNPPPPEPPLRARPLVLTKEQLGLDGKKRRSKSKGRTRRLQDIERGVSKAVRRVARATEHGVSEYIDRRDDSERKRKDGPLVDLYENVARGVSVAVSEAGPAGVDVAKAFNSKKSRRQIRSVLKSLPRLPIIG